MDETLADIKQTGILAYRMVNLFSVISSEWLSVMWLTVMLPYLYSEELYIHGTFRCDLQLKAALLNK